MKRKVLIIPKAEIERHFASNRRQDVKVVAPTILTGELFKILKTQGKDLKPEQRLEGDEWKYTAADQPNNICESGDFVDASLPQYVEGPFALSFANEHAVQDSHYHWRHLEIYFSEHPLSVEYRTTEAGRLCSAHLESGGAIILGPQVVHRVTLGGLTMVIEVPAVASDKFNEEL